MQAFFSRDSGVPSPSNIPAQGAPAAIASTLRVHHSLQLQHGMVLAVPLPQEHDLAAQIEPHIAAALKEADDKGVRGAAITPFLLDKVSCYPV